MERKAGPGRSSRTGKGALALTLLLLVACGGDASTPSDTAAEPETEAPAAGATELAASPVVANLEQPYASEASGAPADPTPEILPAPPGTVDAHFYRTDLNYVVVFSGLDPAAGPLCPGSSIQLADGNFDNASNRPTGEGGCPEQYHLAGPDVIICGSLIVAQSEVPVGAEGTLYASVDKLGADGSVAGMTGSVAADPDATPEIDLEAQSFTLPSELGGGEVTCASSLG